MRIGKTFAAVCAAICVQAAAASAQSLTLAEVLARARERAPQIVSARLELEEARAALAGASLRFQANPEIDAAIGPRRGSGAYFTDFELGMGQAFEPGARRSARIAGANAAIARSTVNIEAVTREVLRAAAAAYYRVVYANERIRLLTSAGELAASVHATADRRFKAGDIAVLDVNIARASLARVRSEREGAEALKAMALGELRQLLGIDAGLDAAGPLPQPAAPDLSAALQSAAGRPELRALETAIQQAAADVQLGESFSKPEYGVGVRYAREENDQILLGGMTVTLPMFSKGQEQRAVGSARVSRLRAELEAARARVQLEVRTAFEAHGRRLAAVRVLEAEAIPGIEENEQLTARSFEVGQLGLPELLLIRREILDTRVEYLAALLEAALARIDLDASAAVLR
jgi:cobalt-zinc-cadmium efflux system outer membrane protein